MAAERADQAACRRIAKFGHTGEAGHATSDDERLAIRTEVHRIRLPRNVDGCHLAWWHGRSASRSGHDHEPTSADNGHAAAVGRDRRGGHRHRSHVRWQFRNDQRLKQRHVGDGRCRTGRDPSLEDGPVGRRHLWFVIGRHVIPFLAEDSLDHDRSGNVTRHDRVARFSATLTERCERLDGQFTLFVAVVVTSGAVGPQDRRDITFVRRRRMAITGDRSHAHENSNGDAAP